MRKLIICLFFLLFVIGCATTEQIDRQEERTESDLERNNSIASDVTTSEREIVHYHGDVHMGGDTDLLQEYVIRILQNNKFALILEILDPIEKNVLQRVMCDISDDFNEDTIRHGVQVVDVNDDGSEDFIIDIGFDKSGKKRSAVCFIYNPDLDQYTLLKGFDELNDPMYLPSQKAVLVSFLPMIYPPGYEKYEIKDDELIMVARLTWEESERYGSIYTEEHVVEGKLEVVKSNVMESDIDFDKWGKELGIWE